ncbi:polymer-forming cytoskeletal protein [Paenibacillus sepulcri]|uniref:Polymer-forming cytoskeletal protein n=1 Tax=Paenibacillus sepulcri TaxID=359917 RepID=A0ABS7C5I0_9BACL|nr:polymer-forming cytoskeletal protein [Paenibacillus sepulcri]
MDESKRRDLNLSGFGSAAGGDYRSVKIDGIGKVEGDLISESFQLNGVATIRGAIRSRQLRVKGKMSVEGDVYSPNFQMEGDIKVHGRMACDEIQLEGLLQLHGDCEAEQFVSRGGFTMDGMLNAERIDILLYGRCQVKEIGGESILVKRSERSLWSKLFQWLIPVFDPRLATGAIEGDNIHLEGTIAQVVRGNRISIGPGCIIERVEYRTELAVHPDAKVNQRIQG